ncbi:hypothetical protein D9758_006836 [Tetrapyrgos nigripes]|uniref:Carboxymuconolactone decarboxylase-like domain-containing protein n=1 Tax=Tetrapyrgos nigripes TaxID=182062 RepID=A0A8H5FT54_9AGAR|nr:hypothetical protein D9758_006836 [Tetrapyrgos nigripes]
MTRTLVRISQQLHTYTRAQQSLTSYKSIQRTKMPTSSPANSNPNPKHHPATPDFLTHLKSLYPTPAVAEATGLSWQQNPWYIGAAVAFNAANEPSAVPVVFKRALDDLEAELGATTVSPSEAHEQRLLLARKVREALFKSGLLCGYSRVINSLVALSEVMPEELKDKEVLRDTTRSLEQCAKDGRVLYEKLYGKSADHVQEVLDAAYPDMGWFSNTLAYGITYGRTDLLSELETCYVIVTSNIAMDTPRQIGWHLDNTRRTGATLEQAQAIREIAIQASKAAGVKWKEPIPQAKEAL